MNEIYLYGMPRANGAFSCQRGLLQARQPVDAVNSGEKVNGFAQTQLP